jgi:4-hydroxybenzoyl-CoA thioesterase
VARPTTSQDKNQEKEQADEKAQGQTKSEALTIVHAEAMHYDMFAVCGRFISVTSLTFRRQLTIEWAHCDPAGIVFNPRFFEFFDSNTWMLFEWALGVKQRDLAAAFGIWSIPLVDASANFLRPSKFGDVVEVTSRVREFRRSSFSIEHRILNHGEIAVEGEEVRVWAGRDKTDPEKIAAATIPADVIARFHSGQPRS